MTVQFDTVDLHLTFPFSILILADLSLYSSLTTCTTNKKSSTRKLNTKNMSHLRYFFVKYKCH